MRIETDRLILRPITLDDAQDTFDYARNPEVGPRAGWEPHKSLEDTRAIMREVFIGQPHVFGIIEVDTGKMVGSVGLLPDPHRQNDRVLMLGYALAQERWGQGYMSEAAHAVVVYGFDIVGVAALSSYTYPFNRASQRVLKKCGFSYEARLQQAEKRFDGKVFDNDCFFLSREAYEDQSAC